MVTAFVARYEPATGLDVVVARRTSASPARRARRHDPIPRRRERRAARNDGARIPNRDAPPVPGSLLVCYTDGLIERRDRMLDDGLAWLEERVREYAGDPLATLCDKLVDDPFVPHPSPDDICVVALRVEP